MAYSPLSYVALACRRTDAEQLPARWLERNERHGARIVDLGEARDEGVAQVLDRGEEAQPQVLIGHAGEEVRVQRLVLRADRPQQDRACRRAA